VSGQHLQPHRQITLLARLGLLLLACGWLLGPAPVALADVIIVNTTSDTANPLKCRLRDAIIAANTNAVTNGCPAGLPGMDTIHFNWGVICQAILCKLTLASPLPKVTEDLTIDGLGLNPTISGDHLYGIFDFGVVVANLSNLYLIDASTNYAGAIHVKGATLTLDHVHISNSQAAFGGAILTEGGTLFVSHSEFISNSADFGGAIDLGTGTAIISSSSFTANVASQSGGAISVIFLSRVDATGSLFDRNRAVFSGGAIYAQDLQVQTSVAGSTFTNNQTLTPTANDGGGAIYNVGVLTLTSSTLADNVSASEGGALYVLYGQATVRNSTFSGNSARGSGGAISGFSNSPVFPARVNLNNVTLSDNTADLDNNNFGDGGGLAIATGFVTATVANSILAGNFDTPNNLGVGTVYPDCSGQLEALHFTLIGLSEGCSVVAGQSSGNKTGSSLNPLDALLGPLADNGGPTQTRALLAGSPALNAGNPAAPGSGGLACEAADQRGLPRPNGFACDMGAFEAGGRLYLPAIQK
jgi:predicted outer membrane repeat protein